MIRLNLVVEGQTEEGFVRQVLRGHLAQYGVMVAARCVRTSRRRGTVYRGGVISFQQVRHDLASWMKEDGRQDARFSTLFDLYRLPDDFPERDARGDPYARVKRLEAAFEAAVEDPRFFAHIQLHEFEALLLADPRSLEAEFLEHGNAIRRLEKMVLKFQSPEEINDGEETAPSKRIVREIPEYGPRKAQAGPSVAERIGLNLLKERCPHFGQWLTRLERLAGHEGASGS